MYCETVKTAQGGYYKGRYKESPAGGSVILRDPLL